MLLGSPIKRARRSRANSHSSQTKTSSLKHLLADYASQDEVVESGAFDEDDKSQQTNENTLPTTMPSSGLNSAETGTSSPKQLQFQSSLSATAQSSIHQNCHKALKQRAGTPPTPSGAFYTVSSSLITINGFTLPAATQTAAPCQTTSTTSSIMLRQKTLATGCTTENNSSTTMAASPVKSHVKKCLF